MLSKIASLLAALTFLIHTFIGGADCLAPMLAADLPLPIEGAMHACWHAVTALLLWSAIVFWRGGNLAMQFGVLWCAFALIFIYVGLVQEMPGGLITNPQWTILGLTGTIAIYDQLRGSVGCCGVPAGLDRLRPEL